MNKPFRPPLTEWSVAEAKAKLSEVIERAVSGTPQLVTRNGKPKVVIVSLAQWEEGRSRETAAQGTKKSLWQAAREAAGEGVELDIARDSDWPKEIEF